MALMMECTSAESPEEVSDWPDVLKARIPELASKKEEGRDSVFRAGFRVLRETPSRKLELDFNERSRVGMKDEYVNTGVSRGEFAYQQSSLPHLIAQGIGR